jgi:plasmid rolling circle replication initiator protein Rep
MECHPKRIIFFKDLSDDDDLVISSYRVALEVNERGNMFYKALRDIVENTYRRHFHLQYKNQSNDFKNQVMHILQEAFLEPWSLRPVRLAIKITHDNKK